MFPSRWYDDGHRHLDQITYSWEGELGDFRMGGWQDELHASQHCLTAFGATALTIAAVKGTNKTDPCAAGVQLIANECHLEKLVWDLVQNSPYDTDLEPYLDMFPNGRFVEGTKPALRRFHSGVAQLLRRARRPPNSVSIYRPFLHKFANHSTVN